MTDSPPPPPSAPVDAVSQASHHGDDSDTTFDRRLLAPIVLGSVLNPVNSSIIAVSLVPIGRAFDAPPSQTAWLVAGLYLATAVGQPLVGRLVDLLGPRRLYLGATALVGVAGLLGLLAQDLWTLVGARVLLGLGTCAGYPTAMYLIRSEARRTGEDSPAGVLTLLSVVNQTVATVGPTLGGFLIGLGGWRTTFVINLPLSLLCLWLGARRLPTEVPTPASGRRPRFDVAGVLLFAVGLTTLMFFLVDPSVGLLFLPVVAAAALVAFVRVERRAEDPFVDVHALRGNPALVASYLRMLLAAIVSYAFLYGYTQWLQEGRGLSPGTSGLLLVPTFLTAIAVSAAVGRHPQIRGKLLVGAVVQIGVSAALLGLDGGSSLVVLVLLAAALGLPQGLLSLANQNAVYRQADPERTASSAGLLRTFWYLGAIGSAAATGLFLGDGANTPGLHRLAWFLTGVAVVLLGLTLADRSLAAVGADVDG